MKLFTVGPVQMFPSILEEFRGQQVPYFRTPEFSELMLDTDRLLRKLVHTADTSRTVYLTASGAAAMEAVLMNCFTEDDRLLIGNGGTFGQRFVDLAAIYGIPYDEVRLPYGEVLGERHFAPFLRQHHTALLVNIDETSTGQLYDIGLLHSLCEQYGMYLVVDAISSFLCDPYDMDGSGIDVTICSTQKGVCVEPGMAFVVLSERILRERVLQQHVRSLYFDFKEYLKNFERGQTPFTPAVGICLELHAALQRIDAMGLSTFLARIAAVAQDFREKVRELHVTVPAFPLSHALTPVVFERPVAYRVFETLKNRHGIMVNPCGGALHETALRIAHIGDTDCEDNTMLVRAMKQAIAEVG